MIEPSTGLFYEVITDYLKGSAIFATRAVNKIVVLNKGDHLFDKVDTLCIDANGVIKINKEFWKAKVKTKQDAAIVFLHEMMHSVLSDTIISKNMNPQEHLLANISMDIRINAIIYQKWIKDKGSIGKTILENMYPSYGFSGLLRPGSNYGVNSKFRLLYNAMYPISNYHNYNNIQEKNLFKNEESIRTAIKILVSKKKLEEIVGKVILIGTHSFNENNEIEGMDEGTKDAIRDLLLDNLSNANARYRSELYDNICNVIKSSYSINNKILERFACSAKINVIKQFYKKPRRITGVIPQNPTNREIVLMACDYIPPLWKNKKDILDNINKNVAIYLDVSGSVGAHLPKILGVIANLKQGIKTIFCFSNLVSEHSVSDLCQGKYETTGGTDFDCIVEHAVEHNIDKCIIFTDGYADLNNANKTLAKEHIKDSAIVYFSGSVNRNNYFEQKYDKHFTLEELVA